MDITTGIRADAHRVQSLYRRSFASNAKSIARGRVIAALKEAGVKTVIDLWGGGVSAEALVSADFRVIAVENGSLALEDRGVPVSRERKRRALQVAGTEKGYETFWGRVEDAIAAYPDANGAYLDFCGPWSTDARSAVIACRPMKCVAVTLVPDHDRSTGASNAHEREMAYQLFLKMAWADKPRWEAMKAGGHVRRLLDYRRPSGIGVYLYLLSHRWLTVPSLTSAERLTTRPDKRARRNETARQWYQGLPNARKKAISDRSLRVGPKSVVCAECRTTFVSTNSRRYCTDVCSKAMHYKQSRALLLNKVAAVSGTAAEAISNDVAA